jgi:hypothetical protein
LIINIASTVAYLVSNRHDNLVHDPVSSWP